MTPPQYLPYVGLADTIGALRIMYYREKGASEMTWQDDSKGSAWELS